MLDRRWGKQSRRYKIERRYNENNDIDNEQSMIIITTMIVIC